MKVWAFSVGLRGQALNHPELRWLKTVVVSVREKVGEASSHAGIRSDRNRRNRRLHRIAAPTSPTTGRSSRLPKSSFDARCIGVALATLARRHVAKHLIQMRPTPLPGSEPAIPASHSSAHTPYGYQFEAALATPVVGRGWRRRTRVSARRWVFGQSSPTTHPPPPVGFSPLFLFESMRSPNDRAKPH